MSRAERGRGAEAASRSASTAAVCWGWIASRMRRTSAGERRGAASCRRVRSRAASSRGRPFAAASSAAAGWGDEPERAVRTAKRSRSDDRPASASCDCSAWSWRRSTSPLASSVNTLSGVTMPSRRPLSASSCAVSASLTRVSVAASNCAAFAWAWLAVISPYGSISARAASLSPSASLVEASWVRSATDMPRSSSSRVFAVATSVSACRDAAALAIASCRGTISAI
mmetsp:Transcript_55215/g.131140  ORF Transcript_55215/g.131140 Transcript_55215/m.131140 type:complete len:227 (+) Transcript_55215:1226-1906(+)